MKKTEKDILAKTYGIFKFRRPTKEEQIAAMNLAGEPTLFKKMVSSDFESFYDTIKVPENGDWLMEHKEFGQSHDEYIRSGIVPVTPQKSTIYLTALSCGENGNLDNAFVNSMSIICESYFYGMKVKLLDRPLDLMNYEIDIRQVGENKLQLSASQILRCLKRELPDDAYCLVAFTDKDLYNDSEIIKPRNYINKPTTQTKNDFCYGLSSIKSRVAVFSFARYDPLFYTRHVVTNKQSEDKLIKYFFILLKRACKVIVKEISHLFGLKNCTFFECNMNGFNSMEEFDKRPFELCPICLRKLYTNIILKTDVLVQPIQRIHSALTIYDRFLKLRDTLYENFSGIFEYEMRWYDARIDSLKNEI